MNYITTALAVRPLSATSQQSSHSDCLAQNRDSVPDARSLDDYSVSGNGGSITNSKVKIQANSTRTKTTFYFCRPPPTTRQKRLHFRPKILMQLQKASEATRPIPVFDVLSTNGFASRLAKEFPGTIKGKYGLGIDDLVVVGSEDYSSGDSHDEEADEGQQKDTWKKREIVAAIAHCGEEKHDGRGNGAEICLGGGRSWIGSPMPKGGYEFVSVDQRGLRMMARWVPRRASRRHSAGPGASSPASPTEGKAFNFSLIDPNSRRHAVIATFDISTLEISDRYNTPLAESTSPSPMAIPEKLQPLDSSVEVDEALRALIIVTSVWVSFCEGFFGHDYATGDPTKVQALTPNYKRRSLPMRSKGIQRQSTTISNSTSPGLISQRPLSIRRSPSSPTAPMSPVSKPIMSPPFLTPPRRTQSTSMAILDRLHSRHALGKEAVSPVSDRADRADGSSYDTRTSATFEQTRILNGRGRSSVQLSKPNEERNKRVNGIKKLCSSIKNSVRGGSSA